MTSRKAWIAGVLGVAAFASTPRAEAQIALPGAGIPSPLAGVGAPGALGASPAAAAAAPQKTIWGFLGLSKSNLSACKDKLCASQFGQLLNGMAVPASAYTGGIVPLLCPPVPNANQLANMPGGPNGAQAVAGKIMQSEADAKARVAAVEYLGTVDCRYWADARKALLNALRADPNECVRFAAARVLGSGCCCSKEVIEKLRVVVSGEEDDDPAEASPRVRAAAFAALQNCLAKVPEVIPPEEKETPKLDKDTDTLSPELKPIRPDRSAMVSNDTANMAVSYLAQKPGRPMSPSDEALSRKTFKQTVEEARRTMFDVAQSSQPSVVLPPGKQSVFHALAKARQDADINARRKANAQGVQAPTPAHDHGTANPAVDPAVNPTSYVVPNPPSRVTPLAEPPATQAADQGSMSKRGLIGYFLKPKAPASGGSQQ